MTVEAKRTPIANNDPELDIQGIVTELRKRRDAALAARQRMDRPVKLPARNRIAEIVDGLSAAMFPNRLSSRELVDGNVDYFVGHTLDATLGELVEQVVRECRFRSSQDEGRGKYLFQARAIVRNFAHSLPEIRSQLETDIEAAYEGDPAAGSIDEVLACYPGVRAITHYRLAHSMYRRGSPLIARIISDLAHSNTGIDIHPAARIGGRFFIDHGTGVVIGETAVIGERVRLYHGVTLGAKRFLVDGSGALVKGNARHPIVEDDVVIYAGATILGRITIGQGSVIGGNVWLTRSVPPGSNITQAKVQNEAFDGGSGI